MRITTFFLLLIITTEPSFSFAQEPLEAVQQNIDKGISVLEDPQYEDDSRKQKQQQILWEIMQQTYDFEEFSRKVLGSHWYNFSARQRAEFVKLFSEFLGKFYLGKLQDRYSGQKVNYLRQQMISKSRALVEVEVLWRNLKVPVQLRVTNRSGQWKVYDLSVLGINAVSNYRAQFKGILIKESPQQIIGRLKDKIAQLDAKS
ncbi:MAG: ABC transporter substrate-binding protein [Deltaproteobacteria bacterium]|nr:ABC transporter substrate-binding protein [Deltaproteobacteria bacterium]